MPTRLRFEFSPEKFVHSAAYLVERCPGMSKMKLFKLLYYADKWHLLKYGRPILGDVYIKMDNGPVPSASYDVIKRKRDWELLDRHIVVRGARLILKATPDLGVLSDSDVEYLNEVVRQYGRKSAEELSDVSHTEKAWVDAQKNGPMDYRLLFGPEDSEMLSVVEHDQELRDLLADAFL